MYFQTYVWITNTVRFLHKIVYFTNEHARAIKYQQTSIARVKTRFCHDVVDIGAVFTLE